MPWTAAAMVVGGLSLVGIPPTAGFLSKWYLVLGALESDLWPVAVLILAGSLIALIYVGRLVEVMYFGSAGPAAAELREAPRGMLIPVWVLAGANLYFGVHTDLTVGLAGAAAAALVGTPP